MEPSVTVNQLIHHLMQVRDKHGLGDAIVTVSTDADSPLYLLTGGSIAYNRDSLLAFRKTGHPPVVTLLTDGTWNGQQ